MSVLTPVRRAIQRATPALALGTAAVTAALAACSDSPTGPTASSRPSAVAARPGTAPLHVLSVLAGDTTITTFVVGTSQSSTGAVPIGNGSKIVFPYGAASICDPSVSSYGPGTWDAPCSAASQPITITAKTWVNPVTGKVATDFSPALRFVPKLPNTVTLYVKDPTYTPFDKLWYCTSGGVCVDESLTDPSLATWYSSGQQWIYRTIKHFSGYTVLVN